MRKNRGGHCAGKVAAGRDIFSPPLITDQRFSGTHCKTGDEKLLSAKLINFPRIGLKKIGEE